MDSNKRKEREYEVVDRTFRIALVLKALFAAGEVLGGLAMIFLTPTRLNALVHWLTAGELKENPSDFIVSHLLIFSQHYTGSAQLIGTIYLLSHGLVKLVVIYFLWRRVLKAYPISIAVIGLFIVYQVWEIVVHHSVLMILATLVDIIVIWLTVLEYRRMQGKW